MSAGDPEVLAFRDGVGSAELLCFEPSLAAVARELFPDYLDGGKTGPGSRLRDVADELAPSPPSVSARVSTPVATRISVRRVGDAYEVCGPGDEPDGHFDVRGAVSEIERRLTIALLGNRTRAYHLHAAALATGDGAVLALGDSGSGKSTIAFHWLLSGRSVLADDVVTIGEDGRVEGFRRLIKVNAALVVAAGLQPRTTVAWHEGADECWIDPRALGGWSPARPPAAIVRVRYDPRRGRSVTSASGQDGLAWLVAGHMDAGLRPERAFSRLTEIAGRVPAFDLVYDDASEATEALARLPS